MEEPRCRIERGWGHTLWAPGVGVYAHATCLRVTYCRSAAVPCNKRSQATIRRVFFFFNGSPRSPAVDLLKRYSRHWHWLLLTQWPECTHRPYPAVGGATSDRCRRCHGVMASWRHAIAGPTPPSSRALIHLNQWQGTTYLTGSRSLASSRSRVVTVALGAWIRSTCSPRMLHAAASERATYTPQAQHGLPCVTLASPARQRP